jgi:hypothetical protein
MTSIPRHAQLFLLRRDLMNFLPELA